MDQELKSNWIAALRSGDYKQGVGRLKKYDSYCCLGVLCDISELGEWNRLESGNSRYNIGDQFSLLMDLGGALDMFGFGLATQEELVGMNDDSRLSFDQIADWIEENL